eukprot:CAMPEP_0183468136 /NCGR_PEP_ID=MMETSP0370-20130417/152226_1 /TAXON_ID=268820 /ORGANISM="Peridinium aciculiferum, Strain PAER-2" /LENGTH=47 /DNA_ID= /DNA_START= /DNA_END= /DNA_ORIENTATION=
MQIQGMLSRLGSCCRAAMNDGTPVLSTRTRHPTPHAAHSAAAAAAAA